MYVKHKNITAILSLFIGLQIILHAAIPHDHHFNGNNKNHKEEKNKNRKSEHCISLNDIISDNSIGKIKKILRKKNTTVYINQNNEKTKIRQNLLFTVNHKKNKPEKYGIFIKTVPVRGSPLNFSA